MRWSIRIARIAGIDVKLHLTFLLLLAWIGFGHYLRGGIPAALYGIVFILLLFGSVLLHEFGHAAAARRYGIPTRDITLLPIGGVARIARMPDEPRQELVVALAGPAVNVVIAAILYLLVGWPTGLGVVAELEDPRTGMLSKLLATNVLLVLFNLIPAFPMDGGRMLRAALAMRMDYLRATQVAASLGQGIAFIFGFIGLFFNPLLVFIALFVYLGATQEAAAAEMRSVTERMPISAAMVTDFRALPPQASLREAAEALLHTSQHEFPVVEQEALLVGILTRDDLIRGLTQMGLEAPVSAVMRVDVPSVSWRTPFDEAFQTMQTTASPVLPVMDDEGRLIGLITPENVGEMMMIQGALGRGRVPFWARSGGSGKTA